MPTVPPVTLADLKEHLKMSPDASDDDGQLQQTLEAATGACEGEVGPILHREVTERVTGTGGALLASRPRLAAVTQVTAVGGATWTTDDLDSDTSGVIRLLSGCFPRGRYDLTYTSGMAADSADIDSDIKLAVLIVAGHMWETQRGRQARSGFIPGEGVTPVDQGALIMAGYSLPRRALELLKPHRLAPAIA